MRRMRGGSQTSAPGMSRSQARLHYPEFARAGRAVGLQSWRLVGSSGTSHIFDVQGDEVPKLGQHQVRLFLRTTRESSERVRKRLEV